MPLSISLFDFDGLDGLIDPEGILVLLVWIITLAFMLVFTVVGECVDRLKRRSPVEKLVRKRRAF